MPELLISFFWALWSSLIRLDWAWDWKRVFFGASVGKPVAMTVTRTSPFLSLSSLMAPKMILAFGSTDSVMILAASWTSMHAEVVAAGDGEEDALGAVDGEFEERGGDGRHGGSLGARFSPDGDADAHERRARVLHDGADVGEVDVDDARGG